MSGLSSVLDTLGNITNIQPIKWWYVGCLDLLHQVQTSILQILVLCNCMIQHEIYCFLQMQTHTKVPFMTYHCFHGVLINSTAMQMQHLYFTAHSLQPPVHQLTVLE